ncbi:MULTISPECIES: CRISPR-associated endoribonuclease Cas6 [Bacillus]|uniref:CRISPR-associated protein n=2 Tax=Bacillus cereus TaxID=1396 RepID=A0A9X6W1R4_BACCE|nr:MULTISPECIES: CRISPR-associated endoribonuclease Cas6 [Bacillus cereus group]PEZ74983.1 CRISPR-associated protein [Bacillus anthracis]MDX5808818.1 CRISPR-associated endoribonuclease Cas6 [Bacillus cereus group sp. BfR-BA-02730]PFA29767.1 CRISPR-associated protein [Bacillus thuringiensis]PFF51860.1 CRISPR-associated protein [Bacillus cereus]PGB10015.1 CRISPR-associated protein [Bacillus toyonensis]
MRIKVSGKILSKTNHEKVFYTHEMYSMLLGTMNPDRAKKIHNQQSKKFRLFTFSNIYINEDTFHFYLSGMNHLIQEVIDSIEVSNMKRVGDMMLSITNIITIPELPKKEKYILKGKVITSYTIDGTKVRIEDEKEIEERLKEISQRKLKVLGIDGDIHFEIIQKTPVSTHYKDDIYIPSWKSVLLVKGDYEAIQALYEVGFGENTATAHGLLWEAV